MADEEQNAAVQAENQAENTPAGNAVQAETEADGSGDAGADNFGEDATESAAVEFEDNFGLGDQQLSAGRIPSVPSSAPKKKTAPPVTPRNREPEVPGYSGESGPGLSVPAPEADNFDGDVALSVDSEDGEGEEKTPEEELFDRFQLMNVPPEFCKYAGWFRAYLSEHPDAMEKLESMLCDEESVAAVRLGMKRLEAFPSPEFQKVMFYLPYGMATERERADWNEHVDRFPEYAALAKGEYPYFDPPQFFYHHGAIFLDDAVKARLAGGVFFQCGAYCGASLIAMSQYKPSMMYGFEPAMSSGVFLQANVKRAGLENVKMFRMCIGDQTGKAVVPDRDKDGKPCKAEVPITSLDYFKRARRENGRTAWIQADVGGMSLPVIRGAEQMIRQDKPLITVAIYHNPEEFFEIVPLLREWAPEYRFMVRRCQCNLRIPYSEITLIAYIP
jgi:FkbM family methyltransferase